MPRISLWNPHKGADFNFADRSIGESLRIAGDGILVHMYEGPTTDSAGNTDTSLTTIQDVLFLTNTNRKYNPNVIELKGHHTPTDTNYDLSQFGIFLSSDVLRVQFHFNDMMDSLGRKLIPGDVLEFPSMRDTPIFENAASINRYYVIEDALYAAGGYGVKWFPHVWLVRARLISGSQEFKQIIDHAATGETSGGLGQGTGIMSDGYSETLGELCDNNIRNSLDLLCSILDVTDEIRAEAERNVFFDPKFFEDANLYIYMDDTGYPIISSGYFSGDGAPPNHDVSLKADGKFRGAGTIFPTDMVDGEYYLRVDFSPDRLYQKQGNCFKLVEVNLLRKWTAENRELDKFIYNNTDTVFPDGTVVSEKQPVSQVLKQKVDLYAERKQQLTEAEAARQRIADERAARRGY